MNSFLILALAATGPLVPFDPALAHWRIPFALAQTEPEFLLVRRPSADGR